MSATSSRAPNAFVCLQVRARPAVAERLVAEAWAAGASGLEERDEADGRTLLLLYAPAPRGAALVEALRAAGLEAEIGQPRALPQVTWSDAWKHGLEAFVVSPRLVVRPPFAAVRLAPGQGEVVIDPGQAFGTGAHASTRLALELLDAALARAQPPPRVLDVGSGSGVLALAALRLGAAAALGFDRDPLAVAEARRNARRNRLAARLALFVGSIDALGAARFDLVVANLLRSELLPLLPALLAHVAPGGRAILAGLLAAERDGVADALGAAGWRVRATRERLDARGDRWLGLVTSR